MEVVLKHGWLLVYSFVLNFAPFPSNTLLVMGACDMHSFTVREFHPQSVCVWFSVCMLYFIIIAWLFFHLP